MKLLCVCTKSHEHMKDAWFLPSLKDNVDLMVRQCNIEGKGTYKEADWSQAVIFKSECIIQAIKENMGDIFVYSDVDVEFFRPFKQQVLKAMEDKDIVGHWDGRKAGFCTGFFGIRANEQTLQLWQNVMERVLVSHCDQSSFNTLLFSFPNLRWGYLPETYFGPGTFNSKLWTPGQSYYIPHRPVMFHANWTIGIDNKLALLAMTRDIVDGGYGSIRRNNREVLKDISNRNSLRATRMTIKHITRQTNNIRRSFERPPLVRLDASTACQLKCPACPTASGTVAKNLGTGFLKFHDFKTFAEQHPWVSRIELSNWGEVFLNPDLVKILQYAFRRKLALTVINGANLNNVSPDVLDAVVKYRVRVLVCSIDGTSQETYSPYRVNGDFNRVIANIRAINQLKTKYKSPYPKLRWQFIAFGHNEHEIENARSMAKALDMDFRLKLSWEGLYGTVFSPIRNRTLIREASGLEVADRTEFEEKYKKSYIHDACHELWLSPQINYDGRLLGCTINHWGDFGNVFSDGLTACLTGEKMTNAKNMLTGITDANPDIPCANCTVYHTRKQHRSWVDLKALSLNLPETKNKQTRLSSLLSFVVTQLRQFRLVLPS